MTNFCCFFFADGVIELLINTYYEGP